MSKATFDLGMREVRNAGGSVEIVADTLTVELDEIELEMPAAKAAAWAIRNGISGIRARGADGHRLFNKTGHLREGIRAQQDSWAGGADVVAPEGYLQEDELVDRLAERVPAVTDPLSDFHFQRAVEEALAALLKVIG